jgi:hypothetical protein
MENRFTKYTQPQIGENRFLKYTQKPETPLQPKPDTPESYIPAEGQRSALDYVRTGFDQGMQGATFGFADEVTDRIGALIASVATNQKYADVLKEARRTTQDRLTEQMQEMPVTSIAANIAGGIGTGIAGATTKAGTALASSLRTGNTAARVGKAALTGATTGAAYGAGSAEDENKLQGALVGGAIGGLTGGAIPAIAAGGPKVISAVTPKVDEALADVANLAQKYKIPVSIDQITNSKVIKNIQKVSQEAPFSGAAAFRDKQMESFNRAITKTIGVPASRITPKWMDDAFTKVGKEFDDLGKGKTFQIDDNFKNTIDEIFEEAKSTTTKDAQENFQNALTKFFANVADDGTISGEKLSRMRAQINKLSRKATTEGTGELLHDLENAVIDLMTFGDDAAKSAFSATKQKYKNLLVLEPLAQKAKGGYISPTQLSTRVGKIYGRQYTRGKAGEIGDLARIGSELLPELGGSDTAQKTAYLLGGASLVGGATNLLGTATALAGNRGYQSFINRNQALVNKLTKEATKKAPKQIPSTLGVLPSNITNQIQQ